MKKPYSVAVIGAGPAGLTVAGYLARAGVRVTLIEKAPEVGGRLGQMSVLFGRYPDARALRDRLLARLDTGAVTVLTNATLKGLEVDQEGYRLQVDEHQLLCQAVVVATGWAQEVRPLEHGLSDEARLYGLSQVAQALALPVKQLVSEWRSKRVAFLLDVSNPFSKVSAATAYQLALTLTQKLAAECYILCRDARVAGYGLESLYGRVRRGGILLLKYEGSRPEVSAGDEGFTIRLPQSSLGGSSVVEMAADQLVLDEAIVTPPGFEALAKILDIRLANRGRARGLFFGDDTLSLEDTGTERAGIFLAGGARSEMDLEETMLSAGAAAARVLNYLEVEPEAQAKIEESLCARCLTCVRLCPYQAITIDYYRSAEKAAARISDRSCRGCGSCVAACPARAIELIELSDQELRASLGGVST